MRRGSKGADKASKVGKRKISKVSSKSKHAKKQVDTKPHRRNKLPMTAVLSRDLAAKYPPHGTWMILEVNDDGESLYERYELLESELLNIFGDSTPFFIPAYIEKVKDKVIGIDLMGGYLFVERTQTSEGVVTSMTSPYIKGKMEEGARTGAITGASINEYKKRLLECIKKLAPKKGALVVPRVGTFKNVEGKVVSIARDRKSVTVVFKKSSRIVQAPVSVLNLDSAGGLV